jgi:hypothetical protein
MVNGQMIVDTESLAIKRSAMAEPINTDSMEIVEETSMSRLVNSQSFGKKSRSQRWNSDETEQFYNVCTSLRMFSFNDSVNLCLFVSSGTGTVGN